MKRRIVYYVGKVPGEKYPEDRLIMQRETQEKQDGQEIGLVRFLRESWLNWLLLLVPASIAIELLGLPKLWLFLVSALAIIPLAGLIGEGTEQLAPASALALADSSMQPSATRRS